jgi:hypothetical protein
VIGKSTPLSHHLIYAAHDPILAERGILAVRELIP